MSIDVQTTPASIPVPPFDDNEGVGLEASSAPDMVVQAGVGEHRQWYQCDSPLGLVQLGIEVDAACEEVLSGTHQVLRQGTLLAENELLVEAIELWQDIQLDPVPVAIDAQRAAISSVIWADITPHDAPALRSMRLALSAAAIPHLKSCEKSLSDHLDFAWSSLSCTLRLSTLLLDATEMQALAPGAVVLLPESFRDDWMVTVSIHEVQVQAQAHFQVEQRSLSIQQLLQPDAPDEPTIKTGLQHQLELELITPFQLNAGKCLGFSSPEPDLDMSWDQGDVRLRLDGQVVGKGHLCRVGAGYALSVSECVALVQDG